MKSMSFQCAIKEFEKSDLDSIVAYWNKNFPDRRNFFKINRKIFSERVVNRVSLVAEFDPKLYLLAFIRDRIVGLVHCGVFKPHASKILFNSTEKVGFLGFISVSPDCRRKGLGTRLLDICIERLEDYDVEKFVVDGQCLNPFYGNSDVLEQPFFDTPEGISVPSDDLATYNFFYKHSYMPRYRGITLSANISKMKFEDVKLPKGLTLKQKHNKSASIITILCDKVVAGQIVMLSMRLHDPKKWGIHRFEVVEQFRGKGLGNLLINRAMKMVKSSGAKIIECISLRELSPEAINFYMSHGFKKDCEWFIY